MTAYVVRRLVLLLPVLWGVGTFVFVLLRLLPGDAVTTLLADSQNAGDIEELPPVEPPAAISSRPFSMWFRSAWKFSSIVPNPSTIGRANS